MKLGTVIDAQSSLFPLDLLLLRDALQVKKSFLPVVPGLVPGHANAGQKKTSRGNASIPWTVMFGFDVTGYDLRYCEEDL